MPIIDRDASYPNTDNYWELVKRTLREVFQSDPDLADVLRREIAQNSAEEQLLFYHAEPLDVAADLAGEPQPSDGQIKNYRLLADQTGWRIP